MSKTQHNIWDQAKTNQSVSKKPSNLSFDVSENPPLITTLLSGLQHTFVFFISITFVVIIIKEMGDTISTHNASSFISLSILAGALTTCAQALKKGPFGSGYLCPGVCGPSYFDATRTAALAGGLPLVFGMTMIAGIIETIFSRFMNRLRILFPSEVTGVAVTMVGIVLVPISVRSFLVIHEKNIIGTTDELTVAFVTIAVMIALNVFGTKNLRLYCTLIGMIVGYILAAMLGLFTAQDLIHISEAKFFKIPYIQNMSWKFDFSLLIPFIVATICSTLKTVGDLVTCQKINDANWRAPDMKSVSNGIFADGLGGIIPGVIGGFGQSTSSTNVGLSLATGVTSRAVAFSMAAILAFMAFLPKLSVLFLIMPKPVMGATLLFAACFMIIAGLQIITSRMLDSRKIFVVGISIIMGLSVDMVPGIYDNIHPWIHPIFQSSLALATILAVLLNLVMRIGIAKVRSIELPVHSDSNQKLYDFMDQNGRMWGARQAVIDKVKNAVLEFNEALLLVDHKELPVNYKISYDELSVDVDVQYSGPKLSEPHNAVQDWLKADEKAFSHLALSMVYFYADRISVHSKGEQTVYHLHFDH